MNDKNYIGIDYGRGMSNVDLKTGIRYGIISINSVNPEWLNDFEPYYGDTIESEDLDWADPISWIYDTSDLKCEYSSDSGTLWVLHSTVIKNCAFCSPCAPGAGDLDHEIENGIPTYGLPDDCMNTEE